jgi:hydroxyacylglutathione hydrolase
MLKVHPVPAFNDNYIWLIESANNAKVMIVDPGDAAPAEAFLARTMLAPAAILITHHHADHTGGIARLSARFDIPIFGPPSIVGITHPLRAGSGQQLHPDFPPFDVLSTPGHTPEHISYLLEGRLFCGDTLFAGGCGRLLGGTAEALFRSLQMLAQLPGNTEIFCAHEYTLANLHFALAVAPDNHELLNRLRATEAMREAGQPSVPSTMALERATNPFLRSSDPQVKRAAEAFCGRPLADDLAVFKVLRRWKDGF